MMIASSTTSPIASTSASRVSSLIENPKTDISASVPISESGMVTTGIRTARNDPRNRNTTRLTMPSAAARLRSTSWRDAFTPTDWSNMIEASIPGGSAAFILAKATRKSRAVVIMLPPGVPFTARNSPGPKLSAMLSLVTSEPYATSATSPSRTSAPFACLTTSWRNSAGLCRPDVTARFAYVIAPSVVPTPVT